MKYGGSFTQGLAGGIQTGLNYGMQAAQIRWQNDQKKKLEAEKVKMQEVWTNFSQSAQQIYETGEMSEETERKLYALMFTLPPELQASANNLLTAVNKNDKTSAEKEFNNFKMVMEVVESTGGRVDDVALDSLINLLSPENQEKIRAVTSAYKSVKPGEVTPIEFYGQSSSETRTGIAESVAGQTPGLEGVQFKQETDQPPTELELQTETQKKLDYAYNTGNASHFNAVAKAEGVDTTFDTYKQKYEKPEVGGGTTEKFRATSLTTLEKYRNNALNADSWEESEKIIKDYTDAGYDATQLGVTQEEWANVKKSDLDNLVAVLNEITAGTPESRNIKGKKKFTFNMDDDETEKTGEEWYKAVYESYNALLKLLEEQGVDVSQYKKLKSLSEIKKIKFGGFVGAGVETGDLISIYY